MIRKLVLVVTVTAAAVVVLAVPVGVSYGYFTFVAGDNVSHPPCEELPSRSEVAQALEDHREFVAQITDVGEGVAVIVGQPCGDADRAVGEIRVASGAQQDSVHEILRDGDGFGVPAVIEQRD